MRAGGLRPLICHLSGAAASHAIPDPDVPPSSISAAAVRAFHLLLKSESGVLEELKVAKGILLPLVDALRHAPSLVARSVTASVLGVLARAQLKHCKAMAKAGVFELLFVLYDVIGEGTWAKSFGHAAGDLARELLCSRVVGARTLERVIRAPGTVQTFSALVILQDCLLEREDDVLGIAVDAGVVKAMVATLEHESPFCVAAAAGALALIMQSAGSRGPALVEASGAIPALVRVIKRRPRPGNPGLFSGAVFKFVATTQEHPIGFNDPIPMALASLLETPNSSRMLDSFLEAGGVPAILRVLRESTCPATLGYNLDLINSLVSPTPRPGSPNRDCEVAVKLHRAGISEAGLEALKKHPKAARGRLLQVLFAFFVALTGTPRSTPLSRIDARAAMAVLVRGNVVELTVNYMAEAPVDMLGCGVGLLIALSNNPEGKQRLGDLKLVDPLIKGITKWLREGHLESRLLYTSKLTIMVSNLSPGFVPAAIKASLMPDLIRFMREICPSPQSVAEVSMEVSESLHATLSCLKILLICDAAEPGSTRKSALEGEFFVSLLVRLINLHDSRTLEGALEVVNLLVVPGSCDEIQRWPRCLPRAVAGLLRATPPLEPALAADTLFRMGMVDRSVMLAYPSWGIENTLKQLTRHSNPDTARAARQLLGLANEGVAEGDVRQMMLSPAASRCVSLGVEPQHLSSRHSTPHSASTTSSLPNPYEESQTLDPAPQPASTLTATSILDQVQRQPGKPYNSRGDSHAKHVEQRSAVSPHPRSPGEGSGHVGASPGRGADARPGEGSSRVGSSPSRRMGASSGEGAGRGGATPARRVSCSPGRRVGASPGRRRADTWTCAHCKITGETSQSGKLKECSGCRSVRYCGRTCQKAHWAVHKATCKRVQAGQG